VVVLSRQEEERRRREEEMLRKREMEEQMRRQREEGYRMGNFMDSVSLAPWSPGVVTLGKNTKVLAFTN